jgi:hypothetical protein
MGCGAEGGPYVTDVWTTLAEAVVRLLLELWQLCSLPKFGKRKHCPIDHLGTFRNIEQGLLSLVVAGSFNISLPTQ